MLFFNFLINKIDIYFITPVQQFMKMAKNYIKIGRKNHRKKQLKI